MKNKYVIAFLLAIMVSMVGCDKGFEEMNVDPLAFKSIDPHFLLADIQDNFAGDRWHYEAAIVQQINLIITGQEAAGNHNIQKDNMAGAQWNRSYGILKNVVDIMKNLEGTTDKTNIYNMAKILKAWANMYLVDYYGDVPYKDALQGYYKLIFNPAYDDQEVIYADIETDLIAAIDALDATKDAVPNDMYYKGNVASWKKFGNSLLLRYAMRLTKVNPTKARQLVLTAINPARGGVMETNADNLIVPHNSVQTNPGTGFCSNSTRQNWHVGRPLVDNMKANNDPRMRYLICMYSNPTSASGGTKNSSPAAQLGCPYGYDPSSIAQDPLYPGEISSNIWKYSMVDRQTAGRVDAITYLMTAAQTQLYLADANVRWGLNTGKTAKEHYDAAIRLNMTQKDTYSTVRNGDSPITTAEINAYLAQPNIDFKTAGTQAERLNQINTQFWLVSWMMWDEAWINFRRTGLPALTPNPYPGADPSVHASSDKFIHRMTYPASEYNYNTANVQAAATSIGKDELGTRVFWDIQ